MRKAASAVLLGLAVASCGTHEDNRLGVDFIAGQAGQKSVRYLTLAPDSSTDYQSTIQASNAGDSPAVTLGSQAGTFVRSLLRFDSLVLPQAGTVVDSAWVRLVYSDGIGHDADSTLAVGLHQVTESWGEATVPDPFPAYLPAADSVTLGLGAVGDTVLVPATSLAQAWVDQPDSNWGMAMVPLDSSAVLLEYSSRNSTQPPQLVVHWTENGIDASVASAVTLDISPISTTPAFVPLNGQPGRLTVGRGLPSGALLRFPLPDIGTRATINRAVLTLHIDHSLSDFNQFTIRFQRVTALPWNADSTAVGNIAYALTAVSSDVDSVRFELGSLLTSIQQHDNFGMLVRAHDNRPDCDYVRFYGPDATDPSLTPLLQLWYTPSSDEVSP